MSKIIIDNQNVYRFLGNQIVKDLLEVKMDLNQICYFYRTGKYSKDDWLEFQQLIGYSVDGFLSILSNEEERFKDEE